MSKNHRNIASSNLTFDFVATLTSAKGQVLFEFEKFDIHPVHPADKWAVRGQGECDWKLVLSPLDAYLPTYK